MNEADTRPHITVATVIERDGKFLMVEERIDGALVLNQPAGHWEAGETLLDAAVRETREETGWRVQIDRGVGIYVYHPTSLPYGFLRIAFAATALEDTGAELDPAIDRALWMSRDEIAENTATHRSPMVSSCLRDYDRGQELALGLIEHLPPGP